MTRKPLHIEIREALDRVEAADPVGAEVFGKIASFTRPVGVPGDHTVEHVDRREELVRDIADWTQQRNTAEALLQRSRWDRSINRDQVLWDIAHCNKIIALQKDALALWDLADVLKAENDKAEAEKAEKARREEEEEIAVARAEGRFDEDEPDRYNS